MSSEARHNIKGLAYRLTPFFIPGADLNADAGNSCFQGFQLHVLTKYDGLYKKLYTTYTETAVITLWSKGNTIWTHNCSKNCL